MIFYEIAKGLEESCLYTIASDDTREEEGERESNENSRGGERNNCEERKNEEKKIGAAMISQSILLFIATSGGGMCVGDDEKKAMKRLGKRAGSRDSGQCDFRSTTNTALGLESLQSLVIAAVNVNAAAKALHSATRCLIHPNHADNCFFPTCTCII